MLLLFAALLWLVSVSVASPLAARAGFAHPGLLHSAGDLQRIKTNVAAKKEPWLTGYNKLTKNKYSQLGYKASPVVGLCRGRSAGCAENYSHAFQDYAACYQHVLRWKISGDARYADEARDIIYQWATTMKSIAGKSPDRMLAAGIYGHQYAQCVELMRDYPAFGARNLTLAQNLLVNVYWPANKFFLDTHLGNSNTTFWANWDLGNMATALSIGIVADRRDIYDYALNYFYNGNGTGAINHFLWKVYGDGMAQGNEAGRNQGHSMLDFALIQPFAMAAYHQGTDIWAYGHNLILKGAEYAAKYNLEHSVNYTAYITYDGGRVQYNQTVISPESRGDTRPIWEMFYNEYVVKRGRKAPYTQKYAAKVRFLGGGAEGGGGDYGGNSGGFDQLGFGTLLYTLK